MSKLFKDVPWIAPLEHLLGIAQLRQTYTQAMDSSGPEMDHTKLLRALDISYLLSGGSLESIPKTGPLVIVSNHPFGGPDALILAEILYSIRKDVKFLANFLLEKAEKTKPYCIYVDPFGKKESTRRNVNAMREMTSWLEDGSALGIFPSGTVSHLHLSKRQICDPHWNPMVARIIRNSDAQVLPVFFHGKNSALFQAAGLIHPRARTLLLPREFCRMRGMKAQVKIGKAIPAERIARFEKDEDAIDYLRLRTYLLGETITPKKRPFQKNRKLQAIQTAAPSSVLEQEVLSLPRTQFLLSHDRFDVFFGRANQMPSLLVEIGRLRELSFREINEGSGSSIDLDRFDNFYDHLCVWDRDNKLLVGAYRLVRTDRILKRYGKKGLYTRSLFRYEPEMINDIGPVIEVGRAFVRSEYQKTYAPLLLLWKGIGRYVAKYPRYKTLLGIVSLSSEYENFSRQLIMAFLRANCDVPALREQIRARHPVRLRKVIAGIDLNKTSIVRDMVDVEEILSELEATHTKIPVLIRKYLDLGARLLGFNIDPKFGDTLDALIYVDLTNTDQRLLKRYLGPEALKEFCSYHLSSRDNQLAAAPKIFNR